MGNERPQKLAFHDIHDIAAFIAFLTAVGISNFGHMVKRRVLPVEELEEKADDAQKEPQAARLEDVPLHAEVKTVLGNAPGTPGRQQHHQSQTHIMVNGK